MLDTDNLLIDTPENVILETEIAGFGSRCMAAFLDYFILFVVVALFSCLFLRSITFQETDSTFVLLAMYGLIQLSIVGYHLLFELLWNGQTPGKRRVGLRVVAANGMPVSGMAVVIRNLVRVFDFFPILYGVGLLSLFATKHTQRLGDLAARVIVIREQKHLTLSNIQEDYTIIYRRISRYDAPPDYIDISKLTAEDRRKIVDFLQRRSELGHNADQIARMLAGQMAKRMELQQLLKPWHLNEVFLEQIARAFELADYDARRDTT